MKRDKIDAVVSDLVREAAQECVICRRSNVRLEAMHIYGRRLKSLRWDLMNLISGCHGCHRRMTENPLEFTDWLLKRFGQGYMDILREKRNLVKRWKPWEKDEMYRHYKSELARVRKLRAEGVQGHIQVESYQ